jgi:outer membrane protein TolC
MAAVGCALPKTSDLPTSATESAPPHEARSEARAQEEELNLVVAAATSEETSTGDNASSTPSSELPPPARRALARPPALSNDSPEQRLQTLVNDLDPANAGAATEPLELSHVLNSVMVSFPVVQSALQEARVASGNQLAARGAFDLKIEAQSANEPMGYYKNYRQAVKLEQPTWGGGSVYGQYRVGNGFFEPWYKERETNEGGEFKLGAAAPLLRGRAIDARRADIYRADLQRQAVQPLVQAQVIDSLQTAAHVYWQWVAAGQAYMVTRELLAVAQQRNEAIARQVDLGNLGGTELQQNERLIASRQVKLIETERKLQSAAIKLSLFWRDADGQPVVPSPAMLPDRFPTPQEPQTDAIAFDIDRALAQRPELVDLALQRQAVQIDVQQSENDLLPNLNAVMEASKDVGQPASPKGDKTPFELDAGLLFDVPLQRRKAYGKLQAASAKLRQLAIKQQFAVNKITAEVQDAVSALAAAHAQVQRTQRNVDLARQLVDAEYRSFELGNSDVLRIAIQEAAELDAQLLAIEALLTYFQAVADYEAALGEAQPPP